MAADPRVAQGVLNRLKGTVVCADHPELNVTASFLGKEGIGLAQEGDSTTYIETMTGAVRSPAPYMMASLTINLLKTQALSGAWRTRLELDSSVGDLVITPDTSAFPKFEVINCAIESVAPMRFNGSDAGYVLTVKGYILVNSSLWDLL